MLCHEGYVVPGMKLGCVSEEQLKVQFVQMPCGISVLMASPQKPQDIVPNGTGIEVQVLGVGELPGLAAG